MNTEKKSYFSKNNKTGFSKQQKNNSANFFKKVKKKYSYKNPLIIPEKKYPIEYKRLGLLKYFLTKYGKIRPRRNSKIQFKQQRKIAKAIRRARAVGLIPCSILSRNYG